MNRLLCLAVLLFSGCTTVKPSPKVIVTNATREPVRDVVVRNGNAVLGRAPLVKGNASMPAIEGLPSGLQISWVDAQGKAHQHDTELGKHVKPTHTSGVYVQIEPGPRVVVKLGASTRKAESDIPWSKPESWEGAPSIPGLNQN